MERRRVSLPVVSAALLAIALTLALALVPAACSSVAPVPPVATGGLATIAVLAPLAGPDRTAGEALAAAVRGVVDGHHGHVAGLELRVLLVDTAFAGHLDPADAVAAFKGAAANPTVVAAVGPLQSAAALEMLPVAAAEHLALVSPTATSPCLTRAGPGCPAPPPPGPPAFFRTVLPDSLAPTALSGWAAAGLAARRYAVVDDGSSVGIRDAARFTASLAGTALSVAATERLPQGADQGAFLARARDAGADGVYAAGAAGSGICRLRARMAAAGFPADAPLLVGGSLLDPACISDAGDAAAGIFGVAPGPDAGHPGTATAMAADLRCPDANMVPVPWRLNACAAAEAVVEAIGRAASAAGGNRPGREAVRAEIGRTPSGWPGAFDSRGDPAAGVFAIYRSDPHASPAGWIWIGERPGR